MKSMAATIMGDTGYTTNSTSLPGAVDMLFTVAQSREYYIDAGLTSDSENSHGVFYYKTFAIGWSDKPVGISVMESDQETPFVYPNPFTDRFFVNTTNSAVTVSIFDIKGQLIFNTKKYGNEFISAGQLINGMYLIELTTDQITVWKKLIKS